VAWPQKSRFPQGSVDDRGYHGDLDVTGSGKVIGSQSKNISTSWKNWTGQRQGMAGTEAGSLGGHGP